MADKDKKQDKLDKRAAALRANMVRRKQRVKGIKKNEKSDDESPNESND